MSFIGTCTQFLEDLILGDFNEEQMVSAQIIGGLISLIPVVDQVMDARDVSGSLFRIHKHGGFAKATLDQKVNLGFAAFGVVPEIGSAFKTVFKPLYKERKAIKGAFNGGVAMIERMLGKRKGGAVRWVKTLNWAGNTQAAIVQANAALASCIEMLEYIAVGHWWCPAALTQLAHDALPGMRAMRGRLDGPIREASAEIKKFLEQMLGEHAAAVAMAVATGAVSLPRGSAASHPHGAHPSTHAPPRSTPHAHTQVQNQARTNGRTTGARVANVVQRTAYGAYSALNYAAKGLMGEHIVDHHVIENKGWGLNWSRHDMRGGPGQQPGGWAGAPKKLNDKETPIFLCVPSAHVLSSGIDSAWLTHRAPPHQYAIVEAKANMNPAAKLVTLLGEAKGGPAAGSAPSRGSGRRKTVVAPSATGASTPPGAGSAPKSKPNMVMQMSHQWILDRIKKEFPRYEADMKRGGRNYSRHVFLVSPLEAAEHVGAIEKIMADGLIGNPAGAQR
jgi:hypothetical protein